MAFEFKAAAAFRLDCIHELITDEKLSVKLDDCILILFVDTLFHLLGSSPEVVLANTSAIV